MRVGVMTGAAVIIAATAACGGYTGYVATPSPSVTLMPSTGPAGLPPGARNPAVTQATVHATICVPTMTGYRNTVPRPPVTYTDALKRAQMTARGLPWTASAMYEEDHFIPLALGGAPASPANLWLQPIGQAHADDKIEAREWHDVCYGRVTLAAAQQAIITWKDTHG